MDSGEAAQPYAELIIQHPSLVRFSTCILCSGCHGFFSGRARVADHGRWSDYVGLGLRNVAVQYGVAFCRTEVEGNCGPTIQSYSSYCIVNSLFMLGAE